jgi:hypothetical protein
MVFLEGSGVPVLYLGRTVPKGSFTLTLVQPTYITRMQYTKCRLCSTF